MVWGHFWQAKKFFFGVMTHTCYTSTGSNKHVFIHITCKNKVLMPSGSRQLWLKTGPKGKKTELDSKTWFFSRAWTWQGGLPNNFPRFFGMYYHPPDHQNIKKNFFGGSKISQKWYPKIAIFCKTTSKTRFGTSFSRFKTRKTAIFGYHFWEILEPPQKTFLMF